MGVPDLGYNVQNWKESSGLHWVKKGMVLDRRFMLRYSNILSTSIQTLANIFLVDPGPSQNWCCRIGSHYDKLTSGLHEKAVWIFLKNY